MTTRSSLVLAIGIVSGLLSSGVARAGNAPAPRPVDVRPTHAIAECRQMGYMRRMQGGQLSVDQARRCSEEGDERRGARPRNHRSHNA